MKHKIVLICILLGALFFRIYNVSQNPPHPNWDEVSLGYNAYSILETGKDEWGQFMPNIFRAYGDYKLPLYIYLLTPLIKLFGLNTFSVRMLSVLAGVASVLFTYLLTQEIFKKKSIALFSALLVAIEPWGLFLSRIALEANLAVAFIISGFYFLLKTGKVKRDFVVSSLLLGLSVWTYNSARIFVPLILFTWFTMNNKKIFENFKNYFLGLLTLAIFFVPMVVQLFTQTGSARYENVKILDQGAIAKIVELRQINNFSPQIERLLYNKATYFLFEFSKNHLKHFEINYLFKEGGDNYQFSLPNHSLVYEINFVFMIFGITYLTFKFKKEYLFLFIWFFIAPIASSLTRETPHVLRNIVFLPLPMIFSAVGFVFLTNYFSKFKKILIIFYTLTLTLLFLNYTYVYFTKYKSDYSQSWQYGHEEAVDYITENYDKFDKIIMTKKYGEPHEFLLYFGSIQNQNWANPQSYQNDERLVRFTQSNWFWVDKFDKFYFMNDWQIPNSVNEKWLLESKEEIKVDSGSVLLVTSPGNYPREWKLVKTIYFLDGKPAFDIVTKI